MPLMPHILSKERRLADSESQKLHPRKNIRSKKIDDLSSASTSIMQIVRACPTASARAAYEGHGLAKGNENTKNVHV
jgi:hypothetical protein